MTLTEERFHQVPAEAPPETGGSSAVQMRLADADALRRERDEALHQVESITLRSHAASQENARLTDLLRRARQELSQQMLDHVSIVTRWEGLYRSLLAQRDEALRDAATWRSAEPSQPGGGKAGSKQDLEL